MKIKISGRKVLDFVFKYEGYFVAITVNNHTIAKKTIVNQGLNSCKLT